VPVDGPLSSGGGRGGSDYFGGDHTGMGGQCLQEDVNMLPTLPDSCGLFHRLLGLIPRDTFVFCIVDGISYYERDVWRQDYELVRGLFGEIVMDTRLGGSFKVLLTSPTISMPLSNDRVLIPHKKVSLRSGRGGSIGRPVGRGYGYHHPGVFDGPSRVGGGRMGFGQNVPMSHY